MPEFSPSEEEASRYVLGELSEAERAEFEERLAQSAELRALVRELEEGTTALAMAASRHRPPPGMWQEIEKALGGKARRVVIPIPWIKWLRNGWAAAAACLIGWMIYALWITRPGRAELSSSAPPSTSSVPETLANETPQNDI